MVMMIVRNGPLVIIIRRSEQVLLVMNMFSVTHNWHYKTRIIHDLVIVKLIY